jgi:3-phenylpropionate/trans-cinnamate dioxygenase ferredoxin subunit
MAFVRVATTEDVPDGEVRVFNANGRDIALAHRGGQFYALDDVCTHDGGPLGEGMLWDEQIECPRHGARFDLKTGRVTALPAVLPVRTYPVKVEGNEVQVDVG